MTTDAEKYALGLAKALHTKHYADVTQWKPLEGDLIGLLTQIDNMTASLSLAPQVKVRDLEWVGSFGKTCGKVAGYRVLYNENGASWGFKEKGRGFYVELDIGCGSFISGPHDTLDAAKSAAQADYTARIMSAMEAPQVEEAAETEHPIVAASRVYEVLKRYRDQGRFDWDYIGYMCRDVAALATTEGNGHE